MYLGFFESPLHRACDKPEREHRESIFITWALLYSKASPFIVAKSKRAAGLAMKLEAACYIDELVRKAFSRHTYQDKK
jgi:hypothetical protein